MFLPKYQNRTTAKRIFERQFNYLLEREGLKDITGKRQHSVYSLRHTAITMRLLESEGEVNLLNLPQECSHLCCSDRAILRRRDAYDPGHGQEPADCLLNWASQSRAGHDVRLRHSECWGHERPVLIFVGKLLGHTQDGAALCTFGRGVGG